MNWSAGAVGWALAGVLLAFSFTTELFILTLPLLLLMLPLLLWKERRVPDWIALFPGLGLAIAFIYLNDSTTAIVVGLAIATAGGVTYVVNSRSNGKRQRESGHQTMAAAESARNDYLRLLDGGASVEAIDMTPRRAPRRYCNLWRAAQERGLELLPLGPITWRESRSVCEQAKIFESVACGLQWLGVDLVAGHEIAVALPACVSRLARSLRVGTPEPAISMTR